MQAEGRQRSCSHDALWWYASKRSCDRTRTARAVQPHRRMRGQERTQSCGHTRRWESVLGACQLVLDLRSGGRHDWQPVQY